MRWPSGDHTGESEVTPSARDRHGRLAVAVDPVDPPVGDEEEAGRGDPGGAAGPLGDLVGDPVQLEALLRAGVGREREGLLIADLLQPDVVEPHGHSAGGRRQLDPELRAHGLVDPVTHRPGLLARGPGIRRREFTPDHLESVGEVEVPAKDRAGGVESPAGQHHQAGANAGVLQAEADPLADLRGVLGGQRGGGERKQERNEESSH